MIASVIFFSKSVTKLLPSVSYASFKLVTTCKDLIPSVKGTTIRSYLSPSFSKTSLITGNAKTAFLSILFL